MVESDWDVVVVGAGPAGLFAAWEIIRERPETRLLLVDSGPSLDQRLTGAGDVRSSSPWSGFGGAGFFIGGRMALDPGSQSAMPLNAPVSEAETLTSRVLTVLRHAGAAGQLMLEPPPPLENLAKKAEATGLTWHSNYPALHLSADERAAALRSIQDALERTGAELRQGESVISITSGTGNSNGWDLELTNKGRVTTRTVVFALGRPGAGALAAMLTGVGAIVSASVSVGVRVETRSAVLAPLTNLTPDPRVSIENEHGRFRTYACAKGAYVTIVEDQGSERISLRPGGANPSDNTSFSVLWEPRDQKVMESLLHSSNGASPLAARMRDLPLNPVAKHAEAPDPTGPLPVGETAPWWPGEYWEGLDGLLGRLDRLAHGTYAPENLVYSPAVERYWRYEVAEDGGLGLDGLFVAGDGAGLSQGAMAAAVSGVLAGRGVVSHIARGQ